MKKITIMAGLMAAAGLLQAQEEASLQAPAQPRPPSLTQKPAPGQPRPAAHSTVIYQMSERGLEILSPGAAPELGMGEKLLTGQMENEVRLAATSAKGRSFGGIRLFGWTF